METNEKLQKPLDSRNEEKSTSLSGKKKVEERHHVPGLVGRIVEKGFSSPQKLSAPQPSVLPFPVARHRSHGPHWAPANAKMDVEEKEEEDGDEMDYDPIAAFANPIERKNKKGLDFSRWREFLNSDASCDASKQKKKQKKKEAVHESSNREMDKRTELTASEDNGLGFSSRGNEFKMEIRIEKPSVSSTTEKELEHDMNGAGSLMSDIHAENLARLQQMSPEEIAEAQAEITGKMDAGLLQMLKKRGRDKLGSKKADSAELDKERKDVNDRQKYDGRKSSTPVVPPSGNWMLSGVLGSSSWKVWSERVEKVRELRFSLDGNVMQVDSTQVQPYGNNLDVSHHNVENVAERDFLRTEGDPAAMGYTINEAVALIRSMVPGQRVLALQILASVLNKALHNLQKEDIGCNIRNKMHTSGYVDWQAVWTFALGPEPQMALSLRIALDDNHDSVVLTCAKVIQYILSCEINESFFNNVEQLETHDKCLSTAPVFRSRPEINCGFLHGGYWKYNTKPSNILPYDNENDDDENEEKHTIQDDVLVAEQDVAAGLIRMGILPRICYLLEMDPLPTLEERLMSVLIALARHSPTCANAIIRCPRLIPTIVKIFTKRGTVEIHPPQTKATSLLKVLSQSSKEICLHLLKHGVFQEAMWHWYKNALTLEQWISLRKENCKLISALMVEQLRFWKVCIKYGYCVTYFTDFFPAISSWLCPPTFEKLIENNVLGEFASIMREAYFVLEALAQRLPTLHSMEQLNKEARDYSDYHVEAWSWSHVVPMVDFAVNWLSIKDIPYVSSLVVSHQQIVEFVNDSVSVSCMLSVISAILHMLWQIFDRIAPESTTDIHETNLPWLPQFVPKVGLGIVQGGFLNFLGSRDVDVDMLLTKRGSLVEGLCYLRQQNDSDISLAAVSCLRGIVRLASSVDRCVQRARSSSYTKHAEGYRSGLADKILEEGIVTWAQNDLARALHVFLAVVSSEWHLVQSVETFGRGGPAPGIGFGWGASRGGFWSSRVLLAQTDVQLMLDLLQIFPVEELDISFGEDMESTKIIPSKMTLALEKVNSILSLCLLVGPGDEVTLNKALDVLLQASVLKCLGSCIHHLHDNRGFKLFDLQYKNEDIIYVGKALCSHFKNRWLTSKKRSSHQVDRDLPQQDIPEPNDALETIHEDLVMSDMAVSYQDCSSLLVEWAHQRLPLPVHWFLSAMSSTDEVESSKTDSSSNVLDVAKSGIFLLLGLEAMTLVLANHQESPISAVPLVWKLHALSTALHGGMSVLDEEKSRKAFEVLQQVYGMQLDQCRGQHIKVLPKKDDKASLPSAALEEVEENGSLEFLDFQKRVHESYTTFVEDLIEQFGAISYGDTIFGRQVAIYLHRSVEVPVRLAAWNALSEAHALELLPPIEKCVAEAKGYLEPLEDNEGILEAYVKAWISGGLERAASRRSMSFTLALHHLTCFIFNTNVSEKLPLRNKLAKALIRSHSQKPHQEGMLSSLIQYRPIMSDEPLQRSEIATRFEILKEACEESSALLDRLEKLKSSTQT